MVSIEICENLNNNNFFKYSNEIGGGRGRNGEKMKFKYKSSKKYKEIVYRKID